MAFEKDDILRYRVRFDIRQGIHLSLVVVVLLCLLAVVASEQCSLDSMANDAIFGTSNLLE